LLISFANCLSKTRRSPCDQLESARRDARLKHASQAENLHFAAALAWISGLIISVKSMAR